MKQGPQNPTDNQLGLGLSEMQVLQAIEKSGYPLQVLVADQLRGQFDVQEEWSYVDRDSNEFRNIDLLASLRLHELESQARIRPHLDLLIECKQSQLPYVFFLSRSPVSLPTFPLVVGLKEDDIVVTTDDDPSSWHFSVLHALNLVSEAFQLSVPASHTFSKCVRKGSDIELSGSDAYNGIILPLIKALQHFAVSQAPPSTALYFDLHLAVAVAVLDAPMVGVEVMDGQTNLVLIPWVRVFRHEYDKAADHLSQSRLWAFDFVHKERFADYVNSQVVPFAQRFAQFAIKHQQELASRKAFVPGMGKSNWSNIESRLQPTSMRASGLRALAGGSALVMQLFHRKPKNRRIER